MPALLGYLSNATPQMNLRVPHPLRSLQRVGSYDRKPQTLRSFFSSLVAGRWPQATFSYLPAATPTIFSIIADANADVPNFVPPVINLSKSYVTLFC